MEAQAQLLAFKALVQAAAPKRTSQPPSKFVKRMEEIPSLELSPSEPCRKALILSERALIGKFTGLWPSPKAVELWIAEHWNPILHGQISLYAAGRGYFVFLFSSKEDRDLIFRSGPFFLGSRGLFLAPWTLGFNPEEEITAAPIWVRLPHLPLHLWGKNSLADIGNKLGRYLDSAEPKGGQFTCARICVEVNLEKGLPEALKLTVGDWSHIQELDYEQIPFKCKSCHVYGHFAKSCPKLSESQQTSTPPPVKDAEFQTVTDRRRPNRRKEPQVPQHKEPQAPQHKEPAPTAYPLSMENKNSFEVLKEVEDQENEAEAATEEPVQGENPPGLSAPPEKIPNGHVEKEASPSTAPPAAKKGVRTPEHEAPAKEVFLLDTLGSSRSEGSSEPDGFSAPSPPLTRGRKTNRERREKEAATNIWIGSQKQLDPYIKGHT